MAASVALTAATAALGPSAVEPPLPGGAGYPPYAVVGLRPGPALVVTLLVVAVALGTAGLAGAIRALRAGWSPSWRGFAAAGLIGVAVLALVPPIGSADPQSYAAYGHIAATGHDPYRLTPAQAYQRYGDQVAAAVEPPWRGVASVYGPVATAEQFVAARLGGQSVRTTVAMLGWLGALAFVVTGAVLLLVAPDRRARQWVAVVWCANPLLLLELVAGAHLDVLVALGAVAAVAIIRRQGWWPALVAGIAIGLAAGVKLPALVVGLGLAWALRRSPGRVAALGVGILAVLVPAYLLAGGHALDQTRTAARYASRGTPWRWLASLLDHTVGQPTSRTMLGAVALLVVAALLALLLRLPPATTLLAGAAFVAAFAYLLATPYVLPWYTAPAWGLLALGAWPLARDDAPPYPGLLLALTGVLAASYLTRDLPLPPGVATLVDALRGGLAPVVLAGVLVATVLTARRAARRRVAAA